MQRIGFRKENSKKNKKLLRKSNFLRQTTNYKLLFDIQEKNKLKDKEY